MIVLYILGGILVLGGVGAGLALLGSGTLKKLQINDVDLKKLSDGTYRGRYKVTRWNYDVEVEVKKHKITSIKQLNEAMDKMSGELTEQMVAAVMEKQSPVIDTVSGASLNTKAFQKAVENALTSEAPG